MAQCVMAFFRSVTSDAPPAIDGNGVVLALAEAADYARGRRCANSSRDFLTPWEPAWPIDDLTRGAFRRRLKRYAEDQRSDLSYSFFIFRKEDDALVGG